MSKITVELVPITCDENFLSDIHGEIRFGDEMVGGFSGYLAQYPRAMDITGTKGLVSLKEEFWSKGNGMYRIYCGLFDQELWDLKDKVEHIMEKGWGSIIQPLFVIEKFSILEKYRDSKYGCEALNVLFKTFYDFLFCAAPGNLNEGSDKFKECCGSVGFESVDGEVYIAVPCNILK